MLTIAPSLTNKGRSLLVRGLAGERITFTRFKVGNGAPSASIDQDDLVDLVNPVIAFDITMMTQNETRGYVTVTGRFDSAANSAAWKFKELGIYAKGEDDVEWLYAYAYDAENGATLPDSTSSVVVEQYVEVIVAVGEATSVTAIVTQNTLFASAEDFQDHIQNRQNPHRVTATQVGLGNVPNVTTNNQTPTFDDTLEGQSQELTNEENLSSMLGKIALAIKNLIAHIANKNNPHNVTLDKIGAAAKKHEHAVTEITSGVLPVSRGGTGVSDLSKLTSTLSMPFTIGFYVGNGTTSTSGRMIDVGFTPSAVLIMPINVGGDVNTGKFPYYFKPGENIYHSGCGAAMFSADAATLFGKKHGGAIITTNGFMVQFSSTSGTNNQYPHVDVNGVSYMYFAFK